MPPKIDKEKCDGCGICIFQCGADCFGFDAFRYKAVLERGKLCTDCFLCQEKCPTQAILVKVGAIG